MATKWPCPEAIDCPCADSNPLGNFSSENADPFTHFSRPIPKSEPPPLDAPPRWWIANSCLGFCYSSISQEDAEACALRNATQCTQPPGPPEPDDPVLFGNRALSCQYNCPEGPPFVLSIQAGTYLARTQELADAIARSFCQDAVLDPAIHHCEMPGPPPTPGTPCPHITGTSTTPLNVNEGDNVTLSVTYTYASTSMLMFVWFKNGIATYATMNATLQLNAVGPGDDGNYQLGIYASGCFPVFSTPIQLNVTSSCPPEAGPDAPNTLDIAHPVEWETWTIAQADLSAVVSANAFCNPTGLLKFTPSNGLDHPPGNYGYRYVAGALRRPALDGGCGANVWVEPPGDAELDIVNQEHNVDSPAACSFQVISGGSNHGWFFMPGDPPPGVFSGSLGGCFASSAAGQASFQIALNNFVHVEGTYPPDNIEVFPHTNLGGSFFGYITDYAEVPAQFIAIAYQLKVLQIEGQIAQPRKLKIDDFGTVSGQFSDPAIGANWNGHIDVRTTYTSTVLQWNAPASGGFGGAQLEYITTHPTSANGKGWRIKIFGAGPTLVWQGLSGTELTPITRFYKDSTATVLGPDCLTCSDNSDTAWSPP